MTKKINSTSAKNKKGLFEDAKYLIQRQEQEIRQLRGSLKKNQLAEENAIRELKTAYSKTYIQNKDSQRCLSFSKTIGNDGSIERNEAHLFAKQHTLIHLKSNSVCTWIPKIGCTNMRYSIPLANGAISTADDIEWVHNNNNSFAADNKELLKANYTFVVLRNPYKRLLSFFLDKLCHDDPHESDKSYSVAKERFKATESTSFMDFVETLWQEPELLDSDIHVKRQTDFLVYNKYDDYFCLENYKQAIEKIFKMTGLKIIDTRGMGSGNTTHRHSESSDIDYTTKSGELSKLLNIGKKPNPRNMYSNELCRKVGVLFQPDVLLYLDKIKDPKEEMKYWLNKSVQN